MKQTKQKVHDPIFEFRMTVCSIKIQSDSLKKQKHLIKHM